MSNVEYLLRNENGNIWAYAFKKNGMIKQCGSRRTQEQADAMVLNGEAVWDAPKAKPRTPSAAEIRDAHERDIQALADANPLAVQPRDWDLAMNRDE